MEEQQQPADINHYLKILYRRRYRFFLMAVVITALVIAAGYLMPRNYEASTTVSIEKNYLKELMKDIAVAPSVEDRVQALTTVMMSRSMLLKVMSDLSMNVSSMSEAQAEKIVRVFQKGTKIKSDLAQTSRSDMELFTISYQDRDPRFARDYVNALIRRYILYSLAAKREQATGASKFVVEQMDLYRRKLARTEQELAQRKREQGVQLTVRLAQLQKKLDALLVQYTERHPEVIRVKAEMESIRERIRERKEAEHADPAALATGQTETAGGVSKKTVADLERDREAYKQIYESLVASLGRSEVSANVETQATADTFHVLDPAILPVLPMGPARWKIILLSLIAGTAGGGGLVILLDMTDRTIRNVNILKGLGLPVIGVIPRIENAAILAAKKRKDLLLYGAACMYVAGVIALAAREFLK